MTDLSEKQNVSMVRISGGSTINDACAQMQGMADNDQQSVIGLFNGRFLMAVPGGSPRNLLAGFFGEHAIGSIIRSDKTVTQSDGLHV